MHKYSILRHTSRIALTLTALALAGSTAHAALVFEFGFSGQVSRAARNAVIEAGNRWSSLFNDNVTLNMTVSFGAAGGSVGRVQPSLALYSYGAVRSALAGDATSAIDRMAVASLQAAPSFGVLVNNPPTTPIPYVETDSFRDSLILLSSANAKALGFRPAPERPFGCINPSCDAVIEFSNASNFDFDQSDGIDGDKIDFTGVALHEIGHALGFLSGLDQPRDSRFLTAFDLFRYSELSRSYGVSDFTLDSRTKYFSINRGVTSIAALSNGINSQASHWSGSVRVGLMDPSSRLGQLDRISAADISAFDAIGWNRTAGPFAVPEPANWALMIVGFGLIGCVMRRRAKVRVTFA